MAGRARTLARGGAGGLCQFFDLSLQRIEAYAVLEEHGLVSAELEKLRRYPNLGASRGTVLLRMAEHELFDHSTAEAGLQHIHQALDSGLDRADDRFARGLLAETTPEALALFQQALTYNPSHHGAHWHSLGLEFLLGQTESLDRHVALLQVLYPEDPSPVIVQAVQLAIEGRAEEAEEMAKPLRKSMHPRTWDLFMAGLGVMREVPKLYDLEAVLRNDESELPKITAFTTNAIAFFLKNRQPADAANGVNLSIQQVPCVKNGLEQALQALLRLVPPLSVFGSPEPALEIIRSACRVHPEGMVPLTAAAFLEPRRPSDPQKLRQFLRLQSELVQMAVDMPSVLPKAQRFARFMAALFQLELGHRLSPPDVQARQSCLNNLGWFLQAGNTTAVQYQACFNLTFELGENDLAREFLRRWELLNPGNQEVIRCRIQLEMASEAYPIALNRLDQLLATDPNDHWALAFRQKTINHIRALAVSIEREGEASDVNKQ